MFLFYLGKTHTLRAWWVGVNIPKHRRYRCAQHLPTTKGNPRWGLRGGGWSYYRYNTGVAVMLRITLTPAYNYCANERRTKLACVIPNVAIK